MVTSISLAEKYPPVMKHIQMYIEYVIMLSLNASAAN